MTGRRSLLAVRAMSDFFSCGDQVGGHCVDAAFVDDFDASGRYGQGDVSPEGGHVVALALKVDVEAPFGAPV